MSSPSTPPQALVGRPDSPELRLQAAQELADKIRGIERLLGVPVDVAHASPRVSGYRARLGLRPDAQGVLGQSPPRSHAHIPLQQVHLARPEINRVLERLPPLPGPGLVELRSDGEQVVLSAWSPRRGQGARNRRNQGLPPSTGKQLASLDLVALGLRGVALDGRGLSGEVETRLEVGGIQHRLSPGTFYQVNLEVNALLVEAVGRLVGETGPTALLDLYAGAGNLSLPLLGAGLPGVLVEDAASAAADARRTARALGLKVDIRTADAGLFQPGDAFFDVAILDPPRAGAPGLLSRLLLTRPMAIIYVSCNPPALARDLRPALNSGYKIDRVEVFDMFPQTEHVEVLCRIRRQQVPA